MLISQHDLKEQFSYSRGVLYKTDGSLLPIKNGHCIVDGIKINLRDLVWMYHYGAIPDGKQIVHLNDDSDDAYIESLRLVDVEADDEYDSEDQLG
jgi:hypothetical protein